MTEDIRNSREPDSGTATFASGDSGTSKDVVTLRSGANFSINDEAVTYDGGGTTEATVELYDEPAGTSAADATNLIETHQLSPGDTISLSEVARTDVEDDVVAVVSGNDNAVSIVVGGYILSG